MPRPIGSFLDICLLILKNSAFQFAYIFGTLFIAGILLTWISRWTQNVFQQFKFPKFGLYVFGVIGIPIHELCHAVFAKIFFHDIKKIKWFDPRGKGNSYGFVHHHYNDKNFYHRVGLFFIGMGPVLLAPVFLFTAYHYLVPGAQPVKSVASITASLIDFRNLSSIGFYVFLYLTVCITSQMELSPDDFKIARGGILPFFVFFLLINTIASVFRFNLHGRFQLFVDQNLILWMGFLALAICVALINFLLCLMLLNITNKLMGAESIRPFRK